RDSPLFPYTTLFRSCVIVFSREEGAAFLSQRPRQRNGTAASDQRQRPVPHPFRKQPFDAGGDRRSGMQGARIGPPVSHVPEDQRVAGLALEAPVEAREGGGAALVVVVEINQKGDDALTETLHFLSEMRHARFDEIEVRFVFLAGLVMQDFGRLLLLRRNADRRGDTC